MVETRTDVKVRYWPSPQEYNEAVQNLGSNSRDLELREGAIETTALGLPRPLTGAFASVYRVRSGGKDMAVRCFLRDITDQKQRYNLISDFVQHDDLPYTVGFDFVAEGIRVGGQWFPVLKMDWVDGPNLDTYVAKNLGTPKIAALARHFKQMCVDLRNAGIAHGDLQHGNIIICNDEIRLVDYDGMFVPKMNGMVSNEVGHRNYQHPARTGRDFAANLDNFSAWAIYTSLCCLAIDPELYRRLGAGDDCLLFRKDDFAQPEYSYAFAVLEHHSNELIVALARHMRWLCHSKIADIPPIDAQIPEPQEIKLPPLPAVPRPKNTAPVKAAGGLPDWFDGPVENNPQQLQWWRNNVAAEWKSQLASVGAAPLVAREPKRYPRFQRNQGHTSPEFYQWLMVFNPIVYLMFLGMLNPHFAPLGLIFMGVNILLEWLIWKEPLRQKRLAEIGKVASTNNIKVVKKASSEGVELFVLSFSFRDSRNNKIVVEREVTGMAAARFNNQQQDSVVYDPDDPVNCQLSSNMMYRPAHVLIPPGVEPQLLVEPRVLEPRDSANGLVLLGQLITNFREWLLVRHGVPSRAYIKKIVRGTTGPDELFYEFPSVNGKIQIRKYYSPRITQNLKEGDEVTVLYDVENPDRHVIYELAHYKVI